MRTKVLSEKKKEFEKVYGDIPRNEKILRSIERLSVKESLFYCYCKKGGGIDKFCGGKTGQKVLIIQLLMRI